MCWSRRNQLPMRWSVPWHSCGSQPGGRRLVGIKSSCLEHLTVVINTQRIAIGGNAVHLPGRIGHNGGNTRNVVAEVLPTFRQAGNVGRRVFGNQEWRLGKIALDAVLLLTSRQPR